MKRTDRVASDIAKRLKEIIGGISDDVNAVEGGFGEALGATEGLFDVDRGVIERELIVLSYIGQRVAIQAAYKDKGIMQAVCRALDGAAQEIIDFDSLSGLIDERGEQYFEVFKFHLGEIQRGVWDKFMNDLGLRFEQFCRGGGAKGEPVIIGDFFSMMPLLTLASNYWTKSFIESFKYIKNLDEE
jgi:hypothetical protein